jgi:hypothetical protein
MTYLKHKIAVMLIIWWLCSSLHEESLNNGIFSTHFLYREEQTRTDQILKHAVPY